MRGSININLKLVFIFSALFWSACAMAQTVHQEDGKIDYKGSEKVEGASKQGLYNRAQKAIAQYVKLEEGDKLKEEQGSGELKLKAWFKLESTFSVIKTLHYTLKLTVENGTYKYHIDDVYLREKVRGGKTTDTKSEDLLKGMETSGQPSIDTEKQLNEIDMIFQKILAQIRNTMQGREDDR